MFSQIAGNWRGRPLASHEVLVQLIANTRTATGLQVRAELDDRHDPTGTKVSDQELAAVNLRPAKFHGEWNYAVCPKTKAA